MTTSQAIDYIHSKFRKGSTPGLHRINALLDMMGHPEKNLRFIHIAGTNGKGSTAAMTASILTQAGFRTGLFTSPFIYRFHERLQIDGNQIADEDIARIISDLYPLAESMEEQVTEFELVTCMAFRYFLEKECDIVVFECGMGGEKDATNVIPTPEVAVITNIGLDHTDALGDTLEKIAMAKAGIFKENGRAVVYRGTPGVEEVFESVCHQRNVGLRKADFDGLEQVSHDLFGQVFHCGSRRNLKLPLLGDHQLHNAAVVLSVIDTLKEKGWLISEEAVRRGLERVTWPGRFDIVSREPLFIIDGGHNPQCIEALVKNIEDYLKDRKVIALTGVLNDKDYGDMYKPVMRYVHSFVCITPPSPRRLPGSELAAHLRAAGAEAVSFEDMESGVREALEKAGRDGVVLCFGSLYSIGAIREALDGLN